MKTRARPLAPDERRDALVAATLPLLREHGRAVTTRQIADAAGVAEGTIFRVFDSKEELVEATLARAFLPGRFVEEVRSIDRDLPLRPRLVAFVQALQARFIEIFGLMRAVGMVSPPDHDSEAHRQVRAEIDDALRDLVGPEADQLTVSPDQLIHVLRLLTFSASHQEIADGRLLSAPQIVDIVMDGVLQKKDAQC